MAIDDSLARLREPLETAERANLLRWALEASPADDLLRAIKAESERYVNVDPATSLRLAEALIHGAEVAGRSDHRAMGLMAKGDALRCQGKFAQSIDLFDEAGSAFLAIGDEVGWARTRMGWLFSSYCVGQGIDALDVVDRAQAILVRHEEWFRAAGLDANAASVASELGRYEQALQLCDRARQSLGRVGESADLMAARIKNNQAVILIVLGEFGPALALLGEVRETFSRLGQTASVLRHDENVADVYAGQGHYTQALRLYATILEGMRAIGLDLDATWVELGMVECYLRLNRDADALALAEEAVSRFGRYGTPTEAAKARYYCALARTRLGDYEAALSMLADAASAFASTGLASQAGLATLERARLRLASSEWRFALADAEQARGVFAERGLLVRQAQAELVQSRALLGLGRHDEAAEVARRALATIREQGADWLAHEAHHLLAEVALATGSYRAALDECTSGVASVERVQSWLAPELRTSFLADKLPIYQDAIDCCLRLDESDLAFQYLERAKSRALIDYLARNSDVRIHTRTAESRVLVDRLAGLREEHSWFANRLYASGLAQRPETGASATEEITLRAAIAEREREIGLVLERLALQRAEPLEGLPTAQVDQDFGPPPLDDDAALLEYYLSPDGGAVFVATRGKLAAVPLEARPESIRRLLGAWQLNLDATADATAERLEALSQNALGISRGLYHALLQPVERHIAGRGRLVIVPYGMLHRVPFHALHDGKAYLVESREVLTCPSSALLRLCAGRARRPGPPSALVVANSDGGRLRGVLDEARVVAALLPGECFLEERATCSAVIERAPHHSIVHLAAHGAARLDNPTFAHLKLADGQLATADVFNLDLDGALVTLSACETGRSAILAGDELIGLSRGFLYAGAATLVQSLWRVEDDSTARLMARFYEAIRDRVSPAAALRASQLALLGGAHPYLWAPFQVIGASHAI